MDKSDVPVGKSKKWLRWLSFSIGALVIIAAAGYAIQGKLSHNTNILTPLVVHNNLEIDLQNPDVLITSHSLGQLPKDLLAIPLLHDTLTEDFVFYYQNNGDRLGLEGSVRRMVYEHDLKLRDKLLSELLDEPATVALWHDRKGRLSHFMAVIQRGGIARLLEPLAFAATSDSQLSKTELSELKVDGASVPLYRLRYNGSSLLFASHGDYLLLLSSPDMMFNGEEQDSLSTELAQNLLAGKAPWAANFGLTKTPENNLPEAKQRIVTSANYLGFGYQRLFPALAGVRFDMDEKGWHSFLALNDSKAAGDSSFELKPIWQAMPMGASVCASLPYSRGIADEMLKQFSGENAANGKLSEQLSGSAGICWYPDSRLYSPLIVAQLTDNSKEQREASGEVFGHIIGAKEANAPEGILAVKAEQQGEAWRWQREVSSRYGNYSAAQSGNAEQLMSSKFFRVSLAQHGNTLLFSLDDKLVDKGLQTLNKAYPPMIDVLPKNSLVPFYVAPEKLSHLLKKEVFDSVPQNLEPIFYNAAQTSLLPKLESLAGHKSYVLMLPENTEAIDAWQWLPINWQDL